MKSRWCDIEARDTYTYIGIIGGEFYIYHSIITYVREEFRTIKI